MDTTNIRKIQGWLGITVDGDPGSNTYTAVSIEFGLSPGQYTKPELIKTIGRHCGIETQVADEEFWKAVAIKIEEKATANMEKNDFYVLEIPATKNPVIPENAALIGILAKVFGGLLRKLQAGMKSKGTFTTGLSTLLGGVVLIVQSLDVTDPNTSIGLLVGGLNAVIGGFGLMLGRDGSTSDEAAGAKQGVK